MLERLKQLSAGSKTLLDNEAFKTAVEEIEQQLLEEFKRSKAQDSESRETIYLSIRALNDIVARLNGYINAAHYEANKNQ